MGLDSLQVSMNTSDWLQGVVDEERPMDSSSPSGDVITCSRPPMLERRLRPPHDQALKCPRCDSTHTKFCYYNNYSLSQPRYFCKTCRRYWTKGGTLRNIPVGGGCRKNKRVAAKKSTDQPLNPNPLFSCHDPTDLHLSFPEIQLSHLTTVLGSHRNLGNPNFMESKYNAAMLDYHTRPIGFMESQLDAVLENSRNQDFIGSSDHLGLVGGLGDVNHGLTPPNFHGFISPFEMNSGAFTDTCQRLMLPFGGCDDQNEIEVKPNNKLLSLDNWQDQGCSEVGKDSLGYLNGLGLWSGV